MCMPSYFVVFRNGQGLVASVEGCLIMDKDLDCMVRFLNAAVCKLLGWCCDGYLSLHECT